MITASIRGGLGNQLFQYAAARALADRHDTELVLDIRGVGDRARRRFQLDAFRIRATIDRRGWRSRRSILHRAGLLPAPRVVVEPPDASAGWFLGLPDSTHLHGYWQQPAFFNDDRHRLVQDLRLVQAPSAAATSLAEELVGAPPTVALHVRRGDYVSDPVVRRIHGALPVGYYAACLDELQALVGEHQVWIFTDDPSWCRRELPVTAPSTLVSERLGDPVEELDLMRRCHHHIIANSSFSWWGAWLARTDEQVVFAPRRWFAGRPSDPTTRFPPDWRVRD